MKRFLLTWILFSASCFAADAPRAEIVDPGVARATLFSPIAATVSAPAPDVQKVDAAAIIKYLSALVVDDLGPTLEYLIKVLVIVALGFVAKHYHINISTQLQDHIGEIAAQGVHYAEEWAAKQEETPTGSDKADKALAFVKTIAHSSAVKNFTDTKLRAIIDAKLAQSRASMATPEAGPATNETTPTTTA